MARRDVVRPDLPRRIQDFHLVRADQRAEDGHARLHRPCDHIVQRLRRHLSEAVSVTRARRARASPAPPQSAASFGDKAECGSFGAHRTISRWIASNGHAVQLRVKLVRDKPAHEIARHVQRRFARPRAGSVEMRKAQVCAAFHHLVGGHRRIVSRRKADTSFARRCWPAARRSLDLSGVDERRPRSDFNASRSARDR